MTGLELTSSTFLDCLSAKTSEKTEETRAVPCQLSSGEKRVYAVDYRLGLCILDDGIRQRLIYLPNSMINQRGKCVFPVPVGEGTWSSASNGIYTINLRSALARFRHPPTLSSLSLGVKGTQGLVLAVPNDDDDGIQKSLVSVTQQVTSARALTSVKLTLIPEPCLPQQWARSSTMAPLS